MELPSPLIPWVNPFPSRVINRTIFFCYALESHECACCLLSFLYFHWLFHLSPRKTSLGTVLFINLLGKLLTPRACVGDGGSIWWAPGLFSISYQGSRVIVSVSEWLGQMFISFLWQGYNESKTERWKRRSVRGVTFSCRMRSTMPSGQCGSQACIWCNL